MKIKYSLITLLALSAVNAEEISLEEVSVTATKIATPTKDISQSIAVVDEQTIEDKNVLNIQDAIQNIPGVIAESSTNSPNPRIIIRGAGLKARYGVREIMVMKDGVPLTDPDSFTRFDFIDMQDVSSVEVQKGPGSINAANTTGGVIQLITKSVFEESEDRIKIGVGDDGQKNINLKVGGQLGEKDFASLTFSKRAIDNDWRLHNEFDATQFSLKHGHIFEDESTLETEFSYTESNMNIPATMNAKEFETFKQTGEQGYTDYQWQNSARDSKIFAINTKYEKEIGDFLFKPRFYFNTWDHFHPVTGLINDANDNSVYGTDIEFDYNHKAFGKDATLVAGVTYKYDKTDDARKYEYADLEYETVSLPYPPFSREEIARTTSDVEGDLAQIEDSRTKLYGAYAMETFSPNDEIIIDISTRVDRLDFDISGDEITAYDFATKNYIPGEGLYQIDKTYDLFSAKLGAVYKLTDITNMYASIATGNQAPTGSEIDSAEYYGIDLDKSTSVNYEIGLKTRAAKLFVDMALYQNDVKDEIVQVIYDASDVTYDNAGKTKKKGFELNTVYEVSDILEIGGAYAYSDYKFVDFQEIVRGRPVSRDGNYLPFIPKNKYSLFAALRMENGFKGRVTTRSWGSYYMDTENTQKYEGYDFITDIMIGYEHKAHNIQLNVQNITNEYYATEALRDVYGNDSYKAAPPRSFMVTYSYQF